MKAFFLWLHKWLGLITGMVVFIVSITGCIYVFHDDLKLWAYPQKYYLHQTAPNPKPLPLTTLLQKAQAGLQAGEKISRVDLYPDAGRTWVFRANKTNDKAFGYYNYQQYYKRVFMNPYTGAIQAVEDTRKEFFQVVLQLHLNLLLGKKIGHPVVGYSTAVFVVLLLTGLVLWWPKKWNRATVKQGLWLNFSYRWKRLNHDLHNVLGFYSLVFAFIISVTGLVFAFPGFKTFYTDSLNKLGSVAKAKKDFVPVPQPLNKTLDNALIYALQTYPKADMMSIRLRDSTEKTHDIQIRLNKDRTGVFRWLYFNQSDGQIKQLKSNENQAPGDKMASLNFDLHIGAIGGLPTKILAFVVSLICASLPVTGFIIWLNKEKSSAKKGKRKSKKMAVS
ncbi:PepSY domain-containing protein [Emticicia sp. 21SJ11W-3]|uniref:PepSY-associated TM helix domain-containing protein n=1 Tax=Emticicia sp. 21SJ11W-3 TaxID=2916755 RepID=UPI00209DDF6D|nr:PepSY-associated TM helix domain-containing protein [Emticicia sp. 21SJ11W-3]UTA66466.1 PepSY domain-containing protein [Emticicia sp. 21SJ11W-3]